MKLFNKISTYSLVSLAIIFSFIFIIINSSNDSLIYNVCSLIVAIFTISYVAITNHQLSQLRKDFYYKNKPLPYVVDAALNIENPNIWINPIKKSASIYSRYQACFTLKNISQDTALNMEMKSTLILVDENDNQKEFFSARETMNSFEPNTEIVKSFLFPMDYDNEIMHSFKNRDLMVVMDILIIFRNYWGKAFKIEFSFLLNTERDSHSSLIEMSNFLIDSQIKNKIDVESLNKIIKNDLDHSIIYEKIQRTLQSSNDTIFIEARPIPIPKEKILEPITYKEYEKIIEISEHVKSIPGKTNHCCSSIYKK